MKIGSVALLGVMLAGASWGDTPPPIQFLTRDGCVQTDRMRANLDAALKRVSWPTSYAITDADTLDAKDPKRGYGTPTVLLNGIDLFGMPTPEAGEHSPT